MKIIGIILIVAGILMFVFREVNFTTEKKVVDVGPIEINKKENNKVTWPMYAAGIAVIAGIGVIVADKKSA